MTLFVIVPVKGVRDVSESPFWLLMLFMDSSAAPPLADDRITTPEELLERVLLRLTCSRPLSSWRYKTY